MGGSFTNFLRNQHEREALEILRSRVFRGSQYADQKIQEAFRIVREMDPDHPLLRYHERGDPNPQSSYKTQF